MMRFVQCALAVLSALLFATPANADQFPIFSTGAFHGWVEDTGNSTGRVVVLPALIAPGVGLYRDPPTSGFVAVDPYKPAPSRGLDYTFDGRIRFTYRIMRDAKYLPADLRDKIAASTGISSSNLSKYTVTFADIGQLQSVTLDVAGRQFVDELGSLPVAGSIFEGTFYLPPDAATLDALQNGQISLTLRSKLPTASYSSINYAYSASAVTDSWLKAFREVTKKTRRTGFNAGFIDFSKSIQRVRVEEDIKGQTNTNIKTDVVAVVRDPTPAQLDRFEKLFGYMEVSEKEMLDNHRAAHNAAMVAGRLNLADAHDKYIKEIEANAPGNSEKILEALSKLADDEAMKFMTAGFRASFGGTSTSYKYSGVTNTKTTTQAQADYNEYIIDTTSVDQITPGYLGEPSPALGIELQEAERRAHYRTFGTLAQLMGPSQWLAGAASAVARKHIGDLNYAFGIPNNPNFAVEASIFRELVDPNGPLNPNGQTLLHKAVEGGSLEVIDVLLRNGANPLARDVFGEDAVAYAHRLGKNGLEAALAAAAQEQGTVTFDITHPGIVIEDAALDFPSSSGSVTFTKGSTKSVLKLSGRPQRSWARLALSYRLQGASPYVAPLKTYVHVPYGIVAAASTSVPISLSPSTIIPIPPMP